MDHYMIRQELNPETCRLVRNNEKTDGHFQRARHKNGSVFCFQWARRRNGTEFIFGSKEPDTWMAQGSFWFQRARHKNGFVSNGPDTRMTQVHFGFKEPDTGMAHLHIYIYIFASKLRTPAPMDSKAGTFSVPDTRLFVGHSLVTGRVAPCLRIKFLKLGWRRERTEGKKREVLHLCRCYTHTHPAGAGSTLKGKRKKKADTRRANGRNSAGGGGERTDLKNQPTRRNGPDPKQRTHLNPTTHYGEARREN